MRKETKSKTILLDGGELVKKYNAWLAQNKTTAKPMAFADADFTEPVLREGRIERELNEDRSGLIPFPLPRDCSISFGVYCDLYINLRMTDSEGASFYEYYDIPYAEWKKIAEEVYGSPIPADHQNAFRDGLPVASSESAFTLKYIAFVDGSHDVQLSWEETRRVPLEASKEELAKAAAQKDEQREQQAIKAEKEKARQQKDNK